MTKRSNVECEIILKTKTKRKSEFRNGERKIKFNERERIKEHKPLDGIKLKTLIWLQYSFFVIVYKVIKLNNIFAY